MDLLLSPEQQAMADAAADCLRTAMPLARLHEADRAGHSVPSLTDASYWSALGSIGLFGLGVPEESGGAGLDATDEVTVFREIGRALGPGPLLGTVLAAHFAARTGEADLLGDLIGGRTRAAVAHGRAGDDLRIGERVTGSITCLDAATADVILVITPDAAMLISAGALTAQAADAMDPTAVVTTGTVDATGRLLDAADGAAFDLWSRGGLLVAAMQCGIAEATRDAAAAHARTRHQFGRPIGAFQAVKHRCAEMAVRAEAAWFQTAYAAAATVRGRSEAPGQASSAVVVSRKAALENAADNIQVHGAMGFAAEADPHLYLRRALALERVFGTMREHLEAVLSRGWAR